MKIGIITINNRIIVDKHNIRSIEIIYLKKYLENNNNSVFYISKKTNKEKNLNDYLDIKDVNLNDFDEIYIHNSNCNFFGGIVDDYTIIIIKKINEFNGNIYYVITDPKLKFVNFAKIIYERINIKGNIKGCENFSKKDYNDFTEKIKNIKAVWTGKDYNLFCNLLKETDLKLDFGFNIPLFQLIYTEEEYTLDETKNKIYDICYYGNNRGGYRSKKLNYYFNNNFFSKYIIGFESNYPKTKSIKYINNSILLSEVNKSYCSLVIGDKEHNNNIITARFFENIKAKVVSFIDLDYDCEKTLYKSERLKKIVYVESPEELSDKIKFIKQHKNLYDFIINEQFKELENYKIKL